MIPNILHFVFLTEPGTGAQPLTLSHYLSVRSALKVNDPQACYFHYNEEPTGEWWTRIKEWITPNKVTVPESFMGRKIYHLAHKSDIIRMQVLYETGGIYMDIDTISVKPLTELLGHRFVIGKELIAPYIPKNTRQKIKWAIRNKLGLARQFHSADPILCNAVLLSEKNSEFIDRWRREYKNFRSKGKDKYWNEHSGKVPLKLAHHHPDLVTLLSPFAFHYPLYTPEGMESMFEKVTAFPEAYLHHLWRSYSWDKYLSQLTVEKIMTEDTTYNLIARRVL